MKKTPKVSVVVPTYNRKEYIGEAVESVLRQTFTDYELIVVDDGSSDGTAEVLKQYGEKINYVYQQNTGQSAARNKGIARARGEYIAFLDSDDLWTADKLTRQVKVLDEHPELGLLFSDTSAFDDKGLICASSLTHYHSRYKLLRAIPAADLGDKVFAFKDKVVSELIQCFFIPTPTTVLVRKGCLDDVGGFDENLHAAEDPDLWIRIARKYDLGFIALPLAKRRRHPHNVSNDYRLRYEARIQLYDKLLNMGEDPGARERAVLKKERGRACLQLGRWFLKEEHNPAKARALLLESIPHYFRARTPAYILLTFLGKKAVLLLQKRATRQ